MATYGIYHNGQWYDDIYYDGHWIDQVYIGKELVWEKRTESLQSWKKYHIGRGTIYKYNGQVYIDTTRGAVTEGYVHVLKYDADSRNMDTVLEFHSEHPRTGIAGVVDNAVYCAHTSEDRAITIYRVDLPTGQIDANLMILDINGREFRYAGNYVQDPCIVATQNGRGICSCDGGENYNNTSGNRYKVTMYPPAEGGTYQYHIVYPGIYMYAMRYDAVAVKKGGGYEREILSESIVSVNGEVVYTQEGTMHIQSEAGGGAYINADKQLFSLNGSLHETNIYVRAACYDHETGTYYETGYLGSEIYRSINGYDFTLWKKTASVDRGEILTLAYLSGVGLLAETEYGLYVFEIE